MSEDPMKMAHDIQQRIERLAYQMWESTGRQVDKAMDYWLEAEREVRATVEAATEKMMPSAAKKEEAKAAPSETKAPARNTAAPAAAGQSGRPSGAFLLRR